MNLSKFRVPQVKPKPIKLDFGCGKNKKEGFLGVDIIKFEGVDHVVDLRSPNWPYEDESVEEAHASHFVEHLTAKERIIFCNELYRILIPEGTCMITTPHWASCRAYGDPTHVWPPVSEFWYYYLSAEWRSTQAPHTDIQYWNEGYACHFDAKWGYNFRPDLLVKNEEYRAFAQGNYKEVILDTVVILTKLPYPKKEK